MASPYALAQPLLGELLVRDCGVAADAIERALTKQATDGGLLGECLIALKLADEDQIAYALATQGEMPYAKDLPKADDVPGDLIEQPINRSSLVGVERDDVNSHDAEPNGLESAAAPLSRRSNSSAPGF